MRILALDHGTKRIGIALRRIESALVMLICLLAVTGLAQTNSVHIAVVPFSAPGGNRALQNAATSLPDLLTSSLSHDSRFSLVEREKINAVWSELHLTEAGLTSADSVIKLGKILSCDWLVSGSLVQTTTGPEVWVKVIDTQSSVLLDLQALAYDSTNFAVTAGEIADFLAQARTRSKPREFIALEKFRDMSISSTRADWTPRLTALIESNLLAAGYGVVEREDVSPIFSEFQLQSAGMTADDTKRVKLTPAFWIVGGSWKWFYDTQDKLSATINIKRMGGGEQTMNFADVPGEGLEKAIIGGIQSALKASGSVTAEQALMGEKILVQSNIVDFEYGREAYAPTLRFINDTPRTSITVTNADGTRRTMTVDPEFTGRWPTHEREMLNTLRRAILLNPKDMKSKFTLGKVLLMWSETNSVDSKQGEDLLEEAAASGDPIYATQAKNWLDDVRSGKISFERRFGMPTLVTHGNPASFPTARPPSTQELAAVNAARLAQITNVAAWSETKINTSRSPEVIAYLDEDPITAWSICGALGKGPLLVACGTNLKSFNWTGYFGLGSGTDFQNVDLPLKLEHPITAINGDKSALWLGTDGGGLIKITAGGGAPVIFGEKDGFPMASIRSLAMSRGKMLIGFGRGRYGAFGYLDLATLKFTGLMSPDATASKPGEEAYPPPPRNAVYQIKSSDESTWWIGSDPALYRLKFDSREWTLELPSHDQPDYPKIAGLRTLSTCGDYTANILSPGGVGIYKISANRWTHLNLSTNFLENDVTTVAIDSDNPKYLWAGGIGKITILDMSMHKIAGQLKLVRRGRIELIIIYAKDVFFFGDSDFAGSHVLYHWSKPEYP